MYDRHWVEREDRDKTYITLQEAEQGHYLAGVSLYGWVLPDGRFQLGGHESGEPHAKVVAKLPDRIVVGDTVYTLEETEVFPTHFFNAHYA